MPTDLARRTGVELVKTGQWATMTGTWTPTREDLAAAVEAQQCPAVRRPRLKLGHTDERFAGDGEPALGWFENLRLGDDGHTLLGDQVALPWLAQVQAAAYPDRSVEGVYRFRCGGGHEHPFVLTAVALLGVTPPAVKTIESIRDLPEMLGVAASEDVPDDAERVQVTICAADGEAGHTGAMVALIPTAEDAARLAVEGGEPAEQLHVTLAYLGEAEVLGVQGRQDVIDAVSSAANGLPEITADVFSVNVFNPPGMPSEDGRQRDTCLVWGLSGDLIDAVHTLITEALWAVPTPQQHRPWHCHMTAVYTDDLSRVPELAAKVGPVTFDRVRMAFAGEVIDIPLIPDGERDPAMESVAASADAFTARIGRIRAAREVCASAPVLPAAEPDQEETPTEEDSVSLSDDMRSRLGLADDADETAALAAIDALKAQAEKTPEPTPEMVAASAAATDKADRAQAAADLMKEELTRVSGELAEIKASAAATVKASFFGGLVTAGKLKPADRETWESRYDRDPQMVTEILDARAAGSEVPVMASGTIGDPEPSGDDEFDKLVASIDAPAGKAV